MKKSFFYVTGFIAVAAISRIVPHPYNFAPLGAMALFGAAYFQNKKAAFLLPLGAYFVSDLLVNNILYADYYSGFVLFYPGIMWTYGAMLLITAAGLLILKKITPLRVAGGALSASLIFFIISNFGVWAMGLTYPLTAGGLAACYTAALPFFHTTILGDLIYAGIMFGAFELINRKVPELKHA